MRRLTLLGLVFLAVGLACADEPLGYPPPAQVKAAFLKLLDRPKVPLDPEITATKELPDGLVLESLTIASEKKGDGTLERVPVLIIRPAKSKGKLPVVVVLHGTGGNRHGQAAFLKELAQRGIMGVAIDARYHGDRAGGAAGAAAYNAAITKAWKTKPGQTMEHPFYYDTCWDIWRTADYLVSRADVDPARLGIIGFSMGGIQTWLAAAVDERFQVVVPAIAVQSFRWSLDRDQWQGRANTIKKAHQAAAADLGEKQVNAKVCRELWNKVIPGILEQFDCPSMLRLCADRSLLILGGTKDPNCPHGGAKVAIAAAEHAFAQAKNLDHFKVMMANVGHQVTQEQRLAALDWFERWLIATKK